MRDRSGQRVDVSFRDLIDKTMGKSMPRADLHISRGRDGELFLTSRQDGIIRMLVPDDGGAGAASANRYSASTGSHRRGALPHFDSCG